MNHASFKRLCFLVIPVAVAAAFAAQPSVKPDQAAVDVRVARVESGLLPPIVIAGRPQLRIPTIPATQSERRRPRVGAERRWA